MRSIVGANVGTADFGPLSKVADLIYFDGPLLSLYRNNEGENLLHHWCESDANSNRWLVFKAADIQLEEYLVQKVTLLDLLKSPKEHFLFCIDFGDELEQLAALIVSPKELPNEYLPSEDSFYDDCPLFDETQTKTTLKISINGDWNFKDLHDFPRWFREAYAFVSGFSNSASSASLPRFPMRDGFSSVHLFKEILASLPPAIAPSLRGVKYASPGAIMLNANRDITSSLMKTLDSVRSSSSPASVTYSYLHGLLADKKLLGVDVQYTPTSMGASKEIAKLAVELARDMDLPNPELIRSKSANSLMAAKIMLAFYRLVQERLLMYERDERISIPTLF